MSAFRFFFSIAILVAASAANSTSYSIYGAQSATSYFVDTSDSIVFSQRQTPFNGILPTSFPDNQKILISGILNVEAGAITAGSLDINDYGLLISGAGKTLDFYSIMDVNNLSISFTNWGAGFAIGGGGTNNCTGPGVGLFCTAISYDFSKPYFYTLTETAQDNWGLRLRFGTQNAGFFQDYKLCAYPTQLDVPASSCLAFASVETPIPSSAWFFASALVGLVVKLRRK